MICLFSVLVNDTFLFSQLSKRGKRERPFLLYLITKVTYILLSLLYYPYSNRGFTCYLPPYIHTTKSYRTWQNSHHLSVTGQAHGQPRSASVLVSAPPAHSALPVC